MKKIIIIGTSGSSIDILDTIQDINRIAPQYECLGFLDDNAAQHGKEFLGCKVLGAIHLAKDYPEAYFINGIGSTRTFLKKAAILQNTGIPLDKFETIVHPTASVSRSAKLGLGTVIFQNVTITTNVTIGNHVIILPNSVISHDDVIGDYTCIAGGVCISGGVRIGGSCYIGTNSSFIENIVVGNNCLIGMGSTVLKDVEANSVMAGSPARIIRKTTDVS